MIEKDRAARILEKLDQALEPGMGPGERADLSVRVLAEELPHFDWVGVYWLQGEELVLG
ncbi:MAG TPA: GAF domain-containing protein, partial [Planctomycetes bacterium]|nr:GAF domain-containing protein [Planctomycetota bacterium]